MKRKNLTKIAAGIVMTTALLLGIQQGSGDAKAAEDRVLHNPAIDEKGTTTWDCVYFGKYWQEDTNKDGVADQNDEKTSLKWRVLSVNGDDVYLLSDKIIESKPYGAKGWSDKNGNGKVEEDELGTWKDCYLRTWLNETFYNEAFTSEEQKAVIETENENEGEEKKSSLPCPAGEATVDKVFLPSKSEMEKAEYGMAEEFIGDAKRITKCTAYAVNTHNKAIEEEWDKNEIYRWWLRAPRGYRVFSKGDMGWSAYGESIYVPTDFYSGVRPVLHIKLSDPNWEKAEKVSADNGIATIYQYTIDGHQIELYHMKNKYAYIKVDGELKHGSSTPSEQVGLGKDGLYWELNDYGERTVYHAETTNYEEMNVWSPFKMETEDGINTYYDENAKELIYDENNYVIGYTTEDGKYREIVALEEIKAQEEEWEKKNETDVEILQKLIKQQKELGATVSEDIDDDWDYSWSGTGRLVQISWRWDQLKGTINLEGLDALRYIYCENNSELNAIILGEDQKIERDNIECDPHVKIMRKNEQQEIPQPSSSTPITSPQPSGSGTPSVSPQPSSSGTPSISPQPNAKSSDDNAGSPIAQTDVNKKGSVIEDTKTKLVYKVTKQGSLKDGKIVGAEVEFFKSLADKTTVKIPDSIVKNGITYRVTSISKSAFNKCGKAKTITIGKNIRKLPKNLFSKCKKLKKIIILSQSLTKKDISKNTFKGLGKKTVIQVPKKKYKSYKKLFNAMGVRGKNRIVAG